MIRHECETCGQAVAAEGGDEYRAALAGHVCDEPKSNPALASMLEATGKINVTIRQCGALKPAGPMHGLEPLTAPSQSDDVHAMLDLLLGYPNDPNKTPPAISLLPRDPMVESWTYPDGSPWIGPVSHARPADPMGGPPSQDALAQARSEGYNRGREDEAAAWEANMPRILDMHQRNAFAMGRATGHHEAEGYRDGYEQAMQDAISRQELGLPLEGDTR